MINSSCPGGSDSEVSGHVAHLAHLLRIAANTTRLLADSAGAKEQVIRGLASRVDELADAFAAIGTTTVVERRAPDA